MFVYSTICISYLSGRLKVDFFFLGGGGGEIFVVCKYTQEEPKQMKHLFNCLGFYCTGYTTMGSFVGRGNQFKHLVKVLYCKLPTIGKQLPTFSHKIRGLNRRPQRWEASVLPLCHHGPVTNERRQPTIWVKVLTWYKFKNFYIVKWLS